MTLVKNTNIYRQKRMLSYRYLVELARTITLAKLSASVSETITGGSVVRQLSGQQKEPSAASRLA